MIKNKILKKDIEKIIKETKDILPKLEGKKILITGASGMLASYIVYSIIYANEKLFKKPAHLYLLTRHCSKFGSNKNIDYLNLDISKSIPNIKDLDYIIHAASKAAPKLYRNNKIDTLNTNILGLYNLLSICNKNLKSFLFFSSAEIYGNPSENINVGENYKGITDHLNERSCYVEGKRAAETICMNYFWERNIPVKVVRIFHTFGPGLNLNDGRIFSDFINFGLENKNITVKGDPNMKRALLYVGDATVMFLKIFLSDKNGEVYNIGSDKNIVSVYNFAKIVCKCFNKHYKNKIKVIIDNKNTTEYYKNAVKVIKPNINKFIKDFNYKPNTGIEKAVMNTIEYYLSFSEYL
ncbi:MAG: NAD-dependent epimerase/dehydratase family protein [Actinobacteria bacterium]|nr:NAD-dependent epimerase/dehydratase family protein [Actinomycetota bacterium]